MELETSEKYYRERERDAPGLCGDLQRSDYYNGICAIYGERADIGEWWVEK